MTGKLSSRLLEFSLLTEDSDLILLAGIARENERKDLKAIFSLDSYNPAKCRTDFRFEKEDIYRLNRALRMPEYMKTKSGIGFKSLEGFCALLRRLAYPNRLSDLKAKFGRSVSELSLICNTVTSYIFDNYGHLLTSFNQWWLSEHHLLMYAAAISAKGSALTRCWGFIDGTLRPCCRPKYNQQECYSGHKRTHGLKYQSIIAPNGIIVNLYGPVPARRHDSYMLQCSNVIQSLKDHMSQLGCNPFYLYADAGYPLKSLIITPHQGAIISQQQQEFNKSMKLVRVAVEWEFGDILKLFAFVDFKKNQKIYLQPIGKQFIVATILKNCHNCLYKSQTSRYFDINPPNLESYLQNNSSL